MGLATFLGRLEAVVVAQQLDRLNHYLSVDAHRLLTIRPTVLAPRLGRLGLHHFLFGRPTDTCCRRPDVLGCLGFIFSGCRLLDRRLLSSHHLLLNSVPCSVSMRNGLLLDALGHDGISPGAWSYGPTLLAGPLKCLSGVLASHRSSLAPRAQLSLSLLPLCERILCNTSGVNGLMSISSRTTSDLDSVGECGLSVVLPIKLATFWTVLILLITVACAHKFFSTTFTALFMPSSMFMGVIPAATALRPTWKIALASGYRCLARHRHEEPRAHVHPWRFLELGHQWCLLGLLQPDQLARVCHAESCFSG